MFAAMAEPEAATITERVLSGKQQKAQTGRWNGGRLPYGYEAQSDTWTIVESQAEAVRTVFSATL